MEIYFYVFFVFFSFTVQLEPEPDTGPVCHLKAHYRSATFTGAEKLHTPHLTHDSQLKLLKTTPMSVLIAKPEEKMGVS